MPIWYIFIHFDGAGEDTEFCTAKSFQQAHLLRVEGVVRGPGGAPQESVRALVCSWRMLQVLQASRTIPSETRVLRSEAIATSAKPTSAEESSLLSILSIHSDSMSTRRTTASGP